MKKGKNFIHGLLQALIVSLQTPKTTLYTILLQSFPMCEMFKTGISVYRCRKRHHQILIKRPSYLAVLRSTSRRSCLRTVLSPLIQDLLVKLHQNLRVIVTISRVHRQEIKNTSVILKIREQQKARVRRTGNPYQNPYVLKTWDTRLWIRILTYLHPVAAGEYRSSR